MAVLTEPQEIRVTRKRAFAVYREGGSSAVFAVDTIALTAALSGRLLIGRIEPFGAGTEVQFGGSRLGIPEYTGDPADAEDGDIWYNTATSTLRGRQGGVNVNLSGGGHNIFSADHSDTTGAAAPVDGDVIIANVTPKWSKLAISIPAANVRHVFGVDNGELRPSWKTALDAINPADIGTAAPGTALVFSHRDHVHAAAAAAISMPKVGAPSYGTLQDWFNQFGSAGILNDTTYVTNLSATQVRVAAGQGLLRTTNSTDGLLKFITWPTLDITVSTTQGAAQYIGIEYNAGTPRAVLHATFDWNYNNDFPIAKVYHDGTKRHIFNSNAHAEDTANKMRRMLREVLPLSRAVGTEAAGALLISSAVTNEFKLTAGKIWHGFNEFDITATDTSVAGTFTSYIRDSTTTWKAPTSGLGAWPALYFDNGTGVSGGGGAPAGLTELTVNRWANLWWYVDAEDSDVVMLYGRAQYVSHALAEAEFPPTNTPGLLTEHGRLLGRFIFQKSATNATVQNVADVSFVTSGITDHNIFSATHDDTTGAAAPVDGDIIIGNVTPLWSKLAISIPAANVRNVLGIDNAELRPSWKTALDATAAADIASAGAAGTSLIFAHRDHVHRGVASFRKAADTILYGAVTISAGANITLTQTGQDIAIAASGGGGAPTDADYLVGTAQGGLSAEIVVGVTPGGELGGTWASPTVDATHSGSAHLALNGAPPANRDSSGAGVATTAQRSDHFHQCFVRPTIHFTGQWHIPGWYSAGFATVTPGLGTLLYIPIFVPRPTTYTGIGISVQTALGTLARLGIYNALNGSPNTLVLDAGTVSTATTGDKIITISQLLQAGNYFLAYVANHVPTLYGPDTALAISPASTGFSGGSVPGGNNNIVTASGRSGDVAGGLVSPAPTPNATQPSDRAVVSLKN